MATALTVGGAGATGTRGQECLQPKLCLDLVRLRALGL